MELGGWRMTVVRSYLRRVLVTAAVCGLGFASSNVSFADDPTISLITPAGLQRGTEAEVLITGARLGDAKKLLFYEPGVEVTGMTADGENKVKVKLKATADCKPGLHSVRLVTETGISNLRYFGVSPLPQVQETEPNSDFAKPQPATLNTTINGVVTNEDVDYYVVELTEGQKITCELEGIRLGSEMFDPFVAILDEKRFEVARSDDAPLLQQDCVCSMKAPRTGKYIIEVRESSFGGNERCQYRLHIGDFPRPLAVIPSGGRPGEKFEATVVDASGETWKESIQLPNESGTFEFISQHDGKVAPSSNRLRVIDLANTNEVEPDTDPATLTAVDTPTALNGILQANGDVDWFKIKGKKDQQLDFTVYGRRILRSPLDSWLEIHKVGGGRLAANDDAGGPDSVQTFKFPEDGEYLVAVRDQLNEGSPFHAYRIEVAPAEKSLNMTIDELERYTSQVLEVPQGSRMAVLLRTNRKNFGGDLGLRMENAPAGTELVTASVAANQSFIPMLIRAAADAPIDGSLTSLIGETLPDGAGVKGNFSQRTMLVRGQNNVDMWGHDTNRMALAVTKAVPFDIEVIQPQVPLVTNGSATLVVKAKRKEGYKEPIRLRVLYSPGGVSASGSTEIPGDKDQVEVPITANSKPAFGSYPITVLARAKNINATTWLASEFVNLEVAESFFDFKFAKAVAELGSSSTISVGLTVKRPPEGEAEFEIVGLPAGVTSSAPIVKLAEGLTQLDFPIQMGPDARAGQFKTLVVKATIKRPSGTIVQTQGTGEVTLTPPAAVPATAVAAAPAATPAAAPAAAPPKPLSRLEQLRQAQQAIMKPAGQ